jgi:hypothetical protein
MTNQRLIGDVTPAEVATRAIGFTPARLAREYARKHSIDIESQNSKDGGDLNFLIAKARFEGDRAKELELRRDNMIRNREVEPYLRRDVNENSVKQYLKKMQSSRYAGVKSFPKKGEGEALAILNEP